MAKYLIHTCNKRYWYVRNHLVPSMLKQGIDGKDIHIHLDKECMGNLKAFIDSLHWIQKNWLYEDGVWHLQDDVIISHDFKLKTEYFDKGMVYGFESEYDRDQALWYSFPCIRIKNDIIPSFLKWLDEEAPKDTKLRSMISNNKYDDALMMEWIRLKYKDYVVRLTPNIVDHIDWLIGGSTVNQQRSNKCVRSVSFKDEDLVIKLRRELYG